MAFSSNPKSAYEGLVLLVDAADHSSYPQLREVEVMVVGGGGGGGMDMGGGGGGGGVVYQSNYKVTPGQVISVTVGAGGWGAPAGSGGYRGDGAGPQPGGHQFTIPATNGGNSVFGSIVALGGGYGGSSYFGYLPDYGIGSTGASGGGNSGYTAGNTTTAPNGTVGQGFKGGNAGGGSYYSGGGGGAGGPGADGPNTPHGGPGIIIPRMSPYYYGGGGGGASYSSGQGGNGGIGGGGGGANGTTVGGAGINNGQPGGGGGGGQWANTPGGNAGANTGGGGGGGAHYNANNQGGNGGSGIVIVRYNGPQAASGGTYSFSNGVSYHTFTSNGEFVPTNGYTVYDLSPNKYALSVGGMESNKISGGVFDFSNDTDANLNLSVTNFTTLDDLTMESVFSPSGTHLNYHGALISSGDWNVAHWALAINQSNDGIVTRRPYIGVIPYTFNIGQWYHLVWRRSGGISNFFVNGVQVGGDQTGSQNDRPLVSNAGNTMIGRETYAGGYFNFNGKIAHTKIYNRALTTAEILSNYRNLGRRI